MALFPQKKGMMSPSMPQGSTRKLMGLPEFAGTSPVAGPLNQEAFQRQQQASMQFANTPRYSTQAPISYNPLQKMIKEREAIDARRMYGGQDLSQDIQSRYGLTKEGLKPAEVERQRASGYGMERATNLAGDGSEVYWDGEKWNRVGGSKPVPSPAPEQPRGAMSPQEQTVSAEYRAPVSSRLENLVNPFSEQYRQVLEGRGITAAEQQYSQAANRARAALASRGLMAGGGTGLEAQLLAQAEYETAAARQRAIDTAQTETAAKAAEFDLNKAQLIDAYNRGLMSEARALSMLPSEVGIGEARARQERIAADIAERTTGARERSVAAEAGMNEAQLESLRIRNQIDRAKAEVETAPEAIRAGLDKVLRDAELGQINLESARLIYERSKEWLNSPGGLFAKEALLEILKGGLQIVGRTAGAGGAGAAK